MGPIGFRRYALKQAILVAKDPSIDSAIKSQLIQHMSDLRVIFAELLPQQRERLTQEWLRIREVFLGAQTRAKVAEADGKEHMPLAQSPAHDAVSLAVELFHLFPLALRTGQPRLDLQAAHLSRGLPPERLR